MRDLSVSIPVNAPSGFTIAFLNSYVRDLGGGREDATMPLRYTIEKLAGIKLERSVVVHVDYMAKLGGEHAQLHVGWEPDGTSIFPSFEGTLLATPTGERTCTLTIEGSYDAPGGVVGQMFDAVVGVQIARGTLETLLEGFRDAAQADYHKRMDFD